MSKSKVVKKPRAMKASDGVPKGNVKYRGAPSNSFMVGNKDWQQRSKHGRDTLFGEAKLLLEAATEYFRWCDENPIYVNEVKTESVSYGGGEGGESKSVIVKVPIARPYTWPALCRYLQCSEGYFRAFKSTHKEGAADFISVIEHIEQTIYSNQFEGASVGTYNANIISRALGLVDKQSMDVGVTEDAKKLFPFGQ